MALSGTAVRSGGGIYESTADQRHPLGARLELDDGRLFRYARASGTALTAGTILMSASVATAHENDLVGVTGIAGEKRVTVTVGAAAIAENAYAEGILFVNDATGAGESYKISGHPAIDSGANGVFTLDDPVITTWGTTQVGLLPNPFNGVSIHTGPANGVLLGVNLPPVGASEYFWMQTQGLAIAAQDTTGLTAGDHVMPSVAVLTVATAADSQARATVWRVAADDNHHGPVWLNCD